MSLMPPLNPEARKGLSGRALAMVIGLAVVITVLALLASGSFISNIASKATPKPLNVAQYGIVLGPDGSITDVIHGPFSGNKDIKLGDPNFVVFYDESEIELLNGPAYGTVFGEVTIGGESIPTATDYYLNISFDDAVTYFNQRVEEGEPLEIPFQTSSLERLVISDATARIEQASDLGKLTDATFEIVGLPTIAYNEEVATQYANEQAAAELVAQAQIAAQAAAAQEKERRQAVIDAFCAEHPEMAHEDLVTICGEAPPAPEPGAPTSDNPAMGVAPPPGMDTNMEPKDPMTDPPQPSGPTDPYYKFMCSTSEVALTNWDDILNTFKMIIGNDLIDFTTPENTSVTQETTQPCEYYSGNGDAGDDGTTTGPMPDQP